MFTFLGLMKSRQLAKRHNYCMYANTNVFLNLKMSQKIITTIGNTKPIRMWIDGKCFNVKQFKGSSKRGLKLPSASSDSESNKEQDDAINIDKISFDVDDNGKLFISFELPSLYYTRLRQNDFFDLNSIRNKTNTKITIPHPDKTGKLTILGDEESNLKEAVGEIYSVIGQIRNRAQALQFIAIPLLSDEIKNNFEKFKNEVLKDKDTMGLDESIFQSPLKLHLTIDVFVLLNDKEELEAIQTLKEYQENILKPLIENHGPFKIHVAGIECMNEDYAKVDVLYANAKFIDETEDINLQKIANGLSEYFYERGLLKKYQENVKLHMTLLNTKYRKEPNSPKKKWAKWISFDANKIMEKYRGFEFGTCDLKAIHISKMSSIGEDGFYQNLASIIL